jgi:hypothetical protein
MFLGTATPPRAAALTIIAPANKAIMATDSAVISGEAKESKDGAVLITVNGDSPASFPLRRGVFSP